MARPLLQHHLFLKAKLEQEQDPRVACGRTQALEAVTVSRSTTLQTLKTSAKIALPILLTASVLIGIKLLVANRLLPMETLLGFGARLGAWGPLLFVLFLAVRPLFLLPGRLHRRRRGMLWRTRRRLAFWSRGDALGGSAPSPSGVGSSGATSVKWTRVDADDLQASPGSTISTAW